MLGFLSLATAESFSRIVYTVVLYIPLWLFGELRETSHVRLLAQGLACSRHLINAPFSQGFSFLICQMGALNYILSLVSGGGDPEGEVWAVLLK